MNTKSNTTTMKEKLRVFTLEDLLTGYKINIAALYENEENINTFILRLKENYNENHILIIEDKKDDNKFRYLNVDEFKKAIK